MLARLEINYALFQHSTIEKYHKAAFHNHDLRRMLSTGFTGEHLCRAAMMHYRTVGKAPGRNMDQGNIPNICIFPYHFPHPARHQRHLDQRQRVHYGNTKKIQRPWGWKIVTLSHLHSFARIAESSSSFASAENSHLVSCRSFLPLVCPRYRLIHYFHTSDTRS